MGAKNVYERFSWLDHRVKLKKYPNATSLSGQFEISLKTAQRDIEFMRDRLNCPLVYDKSRKGYFYESDTFSLPLIYLSSEELSSLLIARKFLQDISERYIGEEISSVVQKITAILQKHMADGNTIDDALSFQLIEYSPTPEEVFKSVLEGCLKRRALMFTYSSPASHCILSYEERYKKFCF
jgi:predicted DNA-binding transcriptional regulator YafY